ncbi:MAG: sigma-54-dependent Fis family transcriptional regulator [Archangiaceae bacterium]|nr:sigma-54-dependent Fis family transcriptional regulator [Archangiaceae bacterium]
MDRLSVRGVGPEQLERELLTLTEKLLPGRHVKLVAAGEPSRGEVFELGDGFGRRLELCVGGAELNEETRDLLRALVRVGSQALELAVLRGNGPSGPSAEPGSTEGAEALGLVAASPQMRALASDLKRLTAARATVIIQGESGTGKEVVAEALHRLSSRAQGPYVPFNCAAVPRELFEGQLFGYRKGAFTGATADHPGVIRAAHGGTLFLDEIAELPLELQPKLLRFLENREVATLGDKRPQVVDVRVIAATHRDLEQAVRAGTFRQDLYYRLQVVALRIPPLRDRPEDIVALARHFVRAMTPEGNDPPALSPDGIAALLAHPWPGNARELRNVIERTLAFSPVPPVLNAQRFALAPVGR